MRRARIKALATVPVRRKNLSQDGINATANSMDSNANIAKDNAENKQVEINKTKQVSVESDVKKIDAVKENGVNDIQSDDVKCLEKKDTVNVESINKHLEKKAERVEEIQNKEIKDEENKKANENCVRVILQTERNVEKVILQKENRDEKEILQREKIVEKEILQEDKSAKKVILQEKKSVERTDNVEEDKTKNVTEKENDKDEKIIQENRVNEVCKESEDKEIPDKDDKDNNNKENKRVAQSVVEKEQEKHDKGNSKVVETITSESIERNNSTLSVEGSPVKSVSNRMCFMRPTPRLDSMSRIRRNSVCGSGHSASESEDDSRRTPVPSRVRTDSVSSMSNSKEPSTPVNVSKSAGSKRRSCISASVKKLADARREFMLKYENKTPDKSKLKMYDLIYYNPAGSPMKKTTTGSRFIRSTPKSSSEEEKEAEESVDDPPAMPVPQVKVGPNGQLIIDQQSLVIEQTKSKVTIDRSKIIVDDEYSNGGFYKKRQVRREWSKWETLKFYKALNNIGTDFLLMQNFFPKRTRQELKLKFKKEERINGALVEKALSKYHEFDTEFLKSQLLIFEENEKKEMEEKSNDKKSKPEPKIKPRRHRKTKTVNPSSDAIDADDEHENENEVESRIDNENGSSSNENDSLKDNGSTQETSTKPTSINLSPQTEGMPESPDSLLQTDKLTSQRGRKLTKRRLNPSPSESEEESDSETEIYKPKPTRSGRVPKVRKLQAPDINTLDNQYVEQKSNETSKPEKVVPPGPKSIDDIRKMIPGVDQIEPGSLVILTNEAIGEPGKNVLQVFMVNANPDTNDPNITPINLTPELLATVTTRMTEVDIANS